MLYTLAKGISYFWILICCNVVCKYFNDTIEKYHLSSKLININDCSFDYMYDVWCRIRWNTKVAKHKIMDNVITNSYVSGFSFIHTNINVLIIYRYCIYQTFKCKGSDNEYVNYNNEFEMDYNIIRSKFRKALKNKSIFFKEEKNFTTINILFPQIWQDEPKKTNPKYKEIKVKNIKREVEILKCVVRFVQDTKRFKKEKYGY